MTGSEGEGLPVARLRGVVKWFNDAKGFGFIEHESGRDVFVHYSVIESEGFKTLKDGEEVEYQLEEGVKGLHAVRVVRTKVAKESAPTKETIITSVSEAQLAIGEPELTDHEVPSHAAVRDELRHEEVA